METNQCDMRIVRYCEIEVTHAINAYLDSVFFEASATKTFPDATARAAFRLRWLGNYLIHHPNEAFLALRRDEPLAARPAGYVAGCVAGYLVGALDDPASDPRQADLTYFQQLAAHTRLFPAHLHVNLAAQYRSHGVGSRLLEAFCAHATAQGSPGVHVVTGQGLRNVGFYTRNGFAPVGEAIWNGRTLVMLGRRLG